MNAPHRHFLTARRLALAGKSVLCAGGALVLSGCAGNPLQDAQVDPRSPIAAEVARAARANTRYPTFADIPKRPADVRPLSAYGRAADELESARGDLERATAPETWTLGDTEAFAARARREAGPEVPPPTRADTEAFAAELRKRATPPPPPQR
jgi:hypothetical protein